MNNKTPKIGVFWLDATNKYLHGVKSMSYDSVKPHDGKYVYPELMQKVWTDFRHEAIKYGDIGGILRYSSDYRLSPRGRVSVENGRSIIYVGDWLVHYKDFLTELLYEEFNLTVGTYGYVIDDSYNIDYEAEESEEFSND